MIRHILTLRLRTVLERRKCSSDSQAKGPAQSAISSLGGALDGLLRASSLPCARAVRSAPSGQRAAGRCRDLFPVPLLSDWPQAAPKPETEVETHVFFANFCIGALNHLNGGMQHDALPLAAGRACSLAQQSAVEHVCSRVQGFLSRIGPQLGDWKGAFASFENQHAATYEPIRGDAVDLPVTAGTCAPDKLIPPALWQEVQDPGNLFPEAAGVVDLTGFPPDMQDMRSRQGYVRLVARELQCGKLRLRRRAKAAARVFAASKTTGRQRKIWDGGLLSEVAKRPPKPARLANPASFLDIVVQPGEALYMSKRDASTYFDALASPESLWEWFGQEPVFVHELLSAGCLGEKELQAALDDASASELLPGTLLYPVNTVWPMGFSWSSCIAQACTLGCALQAGVQEDCILSLDDPLPECQRELCMIATDDTLLFHRDTTQGHSTLQKLDESFQANGIPRNQAKDVTLQTCMTGLGCDLSSQPPMVQPESSKLCRLVLGLCDLVQQPRCSPNGLSRFLGLLQWFFQLQRGMFSILDRSYAFARLDAPNEKRTLPPGVQDELLTSLGLLPLLANSLDRPFLPQLLACDACPEYGFGVRGLQCGARRVEQIGRLAERRGDYIRLVPGPDDKPEVQRIGQPHRLPYLQSEFSTLISCKAKRPGHASLLECHGVLLTVKWVVRNAQRHHHRVVILVDAKAAIGSVSKGRSSARAARALRRVLRSIAAHALAADLLLRLVYIPSESNPADLPSRGVRRKRPHPATAAKQRAMQRKAQTPRLKTTLE
ncbi:unnamed protein product [Symbiodinium sp. CCMP2592]|nr:unnamed protein product [Symbiodinium sp. CCMP2592]